MILNSLSEKSIKTIKSITNSQYLDIIGLTIVLAGSIYLEYHKTIIPILVLGFDFEFPLGIFSIINVLITTMIFKVHLRKKVKYLSLPTSRKKL